MTTEPDLVTIRSFSSEPEAYVAASALKAFEIDCIMSSDDGGGQEGSLTMVNGIRIAVRTEDVGRAEEVLANVSAEAS